MRNIYLGINARFLFQKIKTGAILVTLLLFTFSVFSQAKADRKISLLLSGQNNKMVYQKIPPALKLEPLTVVTGTNEKPIQVYECIVYTKDPYELRRKNIIINSTYPQFVTVMATLDQVSEMVGMADVIQVQAPTIVKSNNDIAVANSGAANLHAGKLNNTAYTGKGVIVAIYDSGIDWANLDFRDPSDNKKSRILRIWDQTLTRKTGETRPTGFGYGVEYTQDQINSELSGATTGFVREADYYGHGTHVAGTAVGNGMSLPSKKYQGFAPGADIVVIKGGEGSFSSSKIIDGLSYLQTLATSLGKPVVLNMSLGGQFGPHDGTRDYEIAVDNFTATQGRAVVISAGNDNGLLIHNKTILPSKGTSTISFTIPSVVSPDDVFSYRLYLSDNSAVTATLTAPITVTGGGGTSTVTAGQNAVNTISTDNFDIYMTNDIDVANNDRYVDIFIDNLLATSNPGGVWTLDITNKTANTPTLHGWLYDKNDSYATTLGSADNNYMVGSPGNATSAITVGSFASRMRWYSGGADKYYSYNTVTQDNISGFSSIGPRRDDVLKPEIAAAGQAVISTLSSSSSPASSDVIIPGLYTKNQGTSMSAPAVTGSVALLFQAKPTATATEIKTLLTSNTQKDDVTELVGPTPNTTWGYGKLDVFKAASSIFNCGVPMEKIYQYEGNYTPAEDAGNTAGQDARYGVRFTPDFSGLLGGAFYAASQTVTDMVVEVRAADGTGGTPGTLLGIKDFSAADSAILKYSWNYFDLNDLNIKVTSGVDYYVVLYRSSAANWSYRRVITANGTRSYASSDLGATWFLQATSNYAIRSIVFSNTAITTGAIVSANSSDTRNLNTSNQFISSCALIAQVVPSGTSPVSGIVESRVWIEPTVPLSNLGTPYVQRHYQITPATNAATATGKITLYFTQAEFTAFNSNPASTLKLPIDGDDVANNKANLRIGKFGGVSADGTGLPLTYPGEATVIDPADIGIKWNSDYNRWEVTFDNDGGFSGFVVQTSLTKILNVNLVYFTGIKKDKTNLLNWKIECDNASVDFSIERSSNGIAFNSIGSFSASKVQCNAPFDFTDYTPLDGNNFYRLKFTGISERAKYSNIVLLQSSNVQMTSLAPNLIKVGGAIQINYFAGEKGNISIADGSGKLVFKSDVLKGSQQINLPMQAAGIYYYIIKDESGVKVNNGKIVLQ